MQLTLKQKLTTYIAGIAIGTLVVGGLVVWPTVNHILTLRNDINIIQQELENRYEKTQKLKRSLQELSTIREVVNQINQIAIEPGDEILVITQLEKIAIENNIEQNTDLNFVDTTKEKTVKTNTKKMAMPQYYKFSFLNNGYFEDHITYLETLEKLPYYLIIDNLSFEKRKGEDNLKNKITLRFDAIVYVKNN